MVRTLLIACCLAACPLSPASANPVPAAQYSITLNGGAPITVPGTFSEGANVGEIESLPAPLLSAHVSGQGTSLLQMQYWFRVDGPLANVEVPIEISGRVAIRAGNAVFQQNMVWGATAQLIGLAFDGPVGPGVNQVDHQQSTVDCSPLSVGPIPVLPPIPSCASTDQDQPVVLTLHTLSGADNEVSLVASANNQEAFAADFDARVDPLISFAPGFDATGYSITLSDGVGNSVPEPSRALLMSAALGVVLRRGRRKPSGRSRSR